MRSTEQNRSAGLSDEDERMGAGTHVEVRGSKEGHKGEGGEENLKAEQENEENEEMKQKRHRRKRRRRTRGGRLMIQSSLVLLSSAGRSLSSNVAAEPLTDMPMCGTRRR